MRLHHVIFGCLLLLGSSEPLFSQQLDTLPGRPGVSFRGLSVINNDFIWVSGSKGTVGRSTNGGKHFNWLPVKGYENRDFRDIMGFDAVTALVVAIDSPGLILLTIDGGANWQEVYRNDKQGVFLDAMDFYNKKYGMAVGDPIDGALLLLRTEDGGRHWTDVSNALPRPEAGEAFFASSGTNIRMTGKSGFTLVTGGTVSRTWTDGRLQKLDMLEGGTSTGANSIGVCGRRRIVVGGDFSRDTLQQGHILVSHNRGRNWERPEMPTSGYRSCVTAISKRKWIACGTSGVDVSADGGRTWKRISTTGYHVVQRARDGKAVYLAGGNGRLAKLRW